MFTCPVGPVEVCFTGPNPNKKKNKNKKEYRIKKVLSIVLFWY